MIVLQVGRHGDATVTSPLCKAQLLASLVCVQITCIVRMTTCVHILCIHSLMIIHHERPWHRWVCILQEEEGSHSTGDSWCPVTVLLGLVKQRITLAFQPDFDSWLAHVVKFTSR